MNSICNCNEDGSILKLTYLTYCTSKYFIFKSTAIGSIRPKKYSMHVFLVYAFSGLDGNSLPPFCLNFFFHFKTNTKQENIREN